MDIKLENVANSSTSYQSYKGNNYVEQEMKVETDELEIKREVEDDSYNFEQRNDDSFTAVFVKNECKIEEETSYTYEDAKSEESCDYNIKKEDIKYSTATENEEIGEFSEDSYDVLSQDIKDDIDITEHSVVIRDEYSSRSPDGSTSQAAKQATNQPKDIGKLTVPLKQRKAGTFACEICKKSFTYQGMLDRHMLYHSRDRPFKCEVCPKTYIEKYELKKHMRSHPEEKPQKCEVCNKTFVLKYDLGLHLQRHSCEMDYKCEDCKKTFATKGTYTKHLKVKHSDDRLYKCEVCNKTFGDNWYLKKHSGIHSGENVLECSICAKKFIRKSSYDVHMRVHSGIRPYKCEVCNKNFRDNGSLKKHIILHSGERPYECLICNKSFFTKEHLNKHFRSQVHIKAKEVSLLNNVDV